MPQSGDFTIQVEPDADRAGRYRWNIVEKGKQRDRSTYSYATRREAQEDAQKFLDKLNDTWRGST
jgi:hypothetical protein